jgi:voltage-gated potassium channel
MQAHEGGRHPGPVAEEALIEAALRPRAVLRVLVRVVLILGATLAAYVLLPVESGSAPAVGVVAALGLVVVLAVFFAQFGRIERAQRPGVAALEALALVGGMYLTLFAFIYVSLSAGSPDAFSQGLDKVAGIYFSVTILATVGFGDIAPLSPAARVLVTVNMVINVVLIGSAVKLLGGKVQSVRERRLRRHSGQDDIAPDARAGVQPREEG